MLVLTVWAVGGKLGWFGGGVLLEVCGAWQACCLWPVRRCSRTQVDQGQMAAGEDCHTPRGCWREGVQCWAMRLKLFGAAWGRRQSVMPACQPVAKGGGLASLRRGWQPCGGQAGCMCMCLPGNTARQFHLYMPSEKRCWLHPSAPLHPGATRGALLLRCDCCHHRYTDRHGLHGPHHMHTRSAPACPQLADLAAECRGRQPEGLGLLGARAAAAGRARART